MRGAVVGSVMVHVAVLTPLIFVRYPVTYIVPGPDVVQVALVSPAAAMPAAPPEVQKEPEPKPEAIRPVEDTGVKLQREREKKKKKEEPQRPVEKPAVAAPALPSATVGAGGLRGDVSLEAGNFEFTYYLVLIRNKIAASWTPPAGISTGGRPVRAVVYFRIGRGGDLSGVRLESTSGVEFFDRSALRAVVISDPLPPLPLGFPGGELGVHFGFEWESQ